jgi:putative ABC transport system permease protein
MFRTLASLFVTVSSGYLRQRWDRALLIVASIGVGVAMLVSTQLLSDALDAAASETVTPGSTPADLLITNNRRVSIDLAEAIRKIPGVADAQPLLVERVILPGDGNRTAVLIGVDVLSRGGQIAERNPVDAVLELTNPLAWLSGRAAVVGRDLALALSPDGRPTRPVPIRAGGRVHSIMPAGVVKLQGPAAKLGGFLLLMDVRQAAALLDQAGLCERIDIYLESGADPETIRHHVQRVVGDRGTVHTPESVRSATQDIVGPIRIGFTLTGIGAMVVGLFLVYNALAVSVAERRHDIGVLRSVGATRWHIAHLFTVEAILLGGLGAILGLPFGWFLARSTANLVRHEMQQVFLTGDQPLRVTGAIVAWALLGGIVTAWLAALVPSMQAAEDEPADAVRRSPRRSGRVFQVAQLVASVALIVGGLSLIFLRRSLPLAWGGYGGLVFLLVGLLLAVPFLVTVLSRWLQPAFRRLLGIEARLAADNLSRAPGRTGVVVGALAAGVALMFQTAGIGESNKRPILAWLDRAVSADLFVICGDPKASSSVLPMQPDLLDDLKALPVVQETLALRYAQPEFQGRLVFLTALDARIYHDSNRHADRLPRLASFLKLQQPNTCLVSENFAALNHVAEGDTIELRGPDGPVPLRIVGVIEEYSWARGTILLDRPFYARAFQDPLIDTIHVFLKPGSGPEAWEAVRRWADQHALVVVSREDFDRLVTSFIRRMYLFAYAQQLAIGIVASLGVVMALLISVLQRRRELGLLRAVGATQAQVLLTVLAEALLMGLFGTSLGILAGIPLEWYLLRVVIFEASGFTFPLTIPWRETLILSGIAVGVSTLAGLIPAVHAARIRIADAIAYE